MIPDLGSGRRQIPRTDQQDGTSTQILCLSTLTMLPWIIFWLCSHLKEIDITS